MKEKVRNILKAAKVLASWKDSVNQYIKVLKKIGRHLDFSKAVNKKILPKT